MAGLYFKQESMVISMVQKLDIYQITKYEASQPQWTFHFQSFNTTGIWYTSMLVKYKLQAVWEIYIGICTSLLLLEVFWLTIFWLENWNMYTTCPEVLYPINFELGTQIDNILKIFVCATIYESIIYSSEEKKQNIFFLYR